ncbi:MAG: LamG domain-containing protein [Bryobacterales bacterium]|nr:LamG domain-containing protein [Bryobacterales bacterium]
MYPLVEPRQRPERFLLNRFSPLAESAAFLGLGGFDAAGSVWYPDARRLLGAVPNDGTLTNMDPASAWSRDLGRAVLDFDGVDDRVHIPDAPSLDLVTGSCAAWCNYTSTAGKGYPGVLIKMASATASDYANYAITFVSSTTNLQWVIGNGTSVQGYAHGSITAGQWAHVAMTWDGAYIRPYINGVPLTPAAQTVTAGGTAYHLQLGSLRANAETIRHFLGQIADAAVSNAVWSAAEISALADPSNVMLSVGGVPLILPPHRVAFPAAVAAGGFKPYWLRRSTQIIGGGIAA